MSRLHIREKITDWVVIFLFAFSLIGAYAIGVMVTTGYGDSGPSMRVPEVNLSEHFGEAWGNIEMVQNIASVYHNTHQYYVGEYDCKYMAMDLWDMLTKMGINTKIMVGSTDANVTQLRDTDHVWIIAEVAPEQWMAVDPTGGYLVCSNPTVIRDIRSGNITPLCAKDNPLYYRGWVMNNPHELENAIKRW